MNNIILLFLSLVLFSYNNDEFVKEDNDRHLTKEELDELYLKQWDETELNRANTAISESYLSNEEKEIYFYLNLVRINPRLFANTYVSSYTGNNGWINGYAFDERKQSLINELRDLEQLPLVYPHKGFYELAQCFALEGGQLGLLGHNREQTSCKQWYLSECIKYGGGKNGLSIVMSFLIDAGEHNAALGHRRTFLKEYPYILGASVEDHINYQFNAVLDFAFDYERIPDYSETNWKKHDDFYLKKQIIFSDNITENIYKHNPYDDSYFIRINNNEYYSYPSRLESIQALYAHEKYNMKL